MSLPRRALATRRPPPCCRRPARCRRRPGGSSSCWRCRCSPSKASIFWSTCPTFISPLTCRPSTATPYCPRTPPPITSPGSSPATTCWSRLAALPWSRASSAPAIGGSRSPSRTSRSCSPAPWRPWRRSGASRAACAGWSKRCTWKGSLPTTPSSICSRCFCCSSSRSSRRPALRAWSAPATRAPACGSWSASRSSTSRSPGDSAGAWDPCRNGASSASPSAPP